MAKGYWVAIYREISDPEKLAAYAKVAGPYIESCGGRFLKRGTAEKVYEAGIRERTTIIEFDSVESAIACHDSAEYAAALEVFDGAAVRDLRFVEGTD